MTNFGSIICRRDEPRGKYSGLDVFTICLAVISLIGLMVITVHSIKELPKQKKLDSVFKWFYGVSITFAIICITSTISATISCVDGSSNGADISMALSIPSYFGLILVLLATFIARLHYTFKDSSYKVSNKNSIIFIVLYSICALSAIIAMVLYIIVLFEETQTDKSAWTVTRHPLMPITMYFCFNCMIFYISTSIWAAKIFVSNLIKVAQLSMDSMQNISQQRLTNMNGTEDTPELQDENVSIQLNEQQRKMIDMISKYVSLFSIGTGSSMITVLVMSSGEWMHWGDTFTQILFIFLDTDCIMNITCMYLQYKFSKKYYDRYVRFIERMWKPIFIKRAKDSMVDDYIAKKEKNGHQQLSVVNENSDCDTEN